MFTTHQPIISEYARHHPETLAEVAVFVIHTARVRLDRAVREFQAWRTNGEQTHLWDWKAEAVRKAWRDADARFDRLESLYPDRDAMLLEAAQWEGFGLEKGGFLLQLAYGLSGCLDTHNKKRLALPERRFDAFKFKRVSIRKKLEYVQKYHETVDQCGGTAVLWDDWCLYIFENAPDRWRDSDQVSAWHALAFDLETPDGQGEDVPF